MADVTAGLVSLAWLNSTRLTEPQHEPGAILGVDNNNDNFVWSSKRKRKICIIYEKVLEKKKKQQIMKCTLTKKTGLLYIFS